MTLTAKKAKEMTFGQVFWVFSYEYSQKKGSNHRFTAELEATVIQKRYFVFVRTGRRNDRRDKNVSQYPKKRTCNLRNRNLSNICSQRNLQHVLEVSI